MGHALVPSSATSVPTPPCRVPLCWTKHSPWERLGPWISLPLPVGFWGSRSLQTQAHSPASQRGLRTLCARAPKPSGVASQSRFSRVSGRPKDSGVASACHLARDGTGLGLIQPQDCPEMGEERRISDHLCWLGQTLSDDFQALGEGLAAQAQLRAQVFPEDKGR